MKNRSLIIMETIWIITGLLCIVAGIKLAMDGGTAKIPIFALMSLICFLFAWIRHRQRKKSKI